MSFRRLSLLALAVVLTACTGKLPAQPGADPVKPGATSKPRASGDPLVVKPPTALSLLKAPAGASSKLAGLVAIDAHYAVKAAGAKLIGADGGTLIGADGASLIGPDGASLIGADGATLVGMDGASVYVGAGLIGADGASLIGPDGASLVAAGAGNLIGKRKLGLLQAAAPEKFNLGTVLRAAAMEIQVRSMADGTLLPLGDDEAGQPVFSVLTNARGEYTIFLPPGIAGHNVVVQAMVPGSVDARLVYGAVADGKGATGLTIDEDTSLASAYFREAFVSRIEREFLFEDAGRNEDAKTPQFDDIPGAGPVIAELKAGVAASGVAKLPAAERRKRSSAVGEAILAFQPLADLVDPETDQPVLAELAKEIAQTRAKVGERMREDPRFFEAQPFMVQANRNLAEGEGPYVIERPSDFPNFVLQHHLVRPSLEGRSTERLEEAIGVVYGDVAVGKAKVARLDFIMKSLLLKSMLLLITNAEAKDKAIAAMYAK